MSSIRIAAAVTPLVALAACGRATSTEPSFLAPSSASASRGQAQPNDDHGGQREAQPGDDRGAHRRGNDDPANHH